MLAPNKNYARLTKTHAAPGEPFVWLTSMGLGIGIIMVVGLLAIIIANGVPVFWPSRVYEAKLKEGVANPVPGTQIIVGEIAQKRTKSIGVLDKDGKSVGDQTEIQFFVGNKDAYGFSFAFVNSDDIASITQPAEIIALERVEYGDAFGTPVSLKLTDGSSIAYGSPDFIARLAGLVKESNARRARIEKIERVDIGRINAQMNELRLKGRGSAEAEKQVAALGQQYNTLAAEARELREQQGRAQFVLKLPNGAEKTIAVGQIIFYYFPNQIGLFQRLGIFAHNVWGFISLDPREANTEGGIFPAIFGTFVMTLLMSVAVMPFGVVAAIYLREYAKQGFFVRAVRIAVNNLAGVPSIVFGVFGLGFFVYFVGGGIDQLFFPAYLPTPTYGTGGIMWAAFTLALMTVPVVIVATEESIAAVPRGMKEGSLACGASKWQTIQRIVLPASIPGILTGFILAMARGAGEVAPLMLVGVVKLAPSLPLDGEFPFVHLERKFMHLGFHIYDLGFQSPDSEAAKPMVFATTLLLIALVVLLNLAAILIRERLRKKFATSAF
jgi:phosphate transport system permease protein